mmetsp:Transcript_1594/g.2208  ORF Transcript_1594/g.2208 Transcript_1594/m.2208 type:complete len:188 (+) Transcript_1594:75-638(+)|eukprot:CAMPEP_0201693870 /NCGR_PEP_ID=MMETSP0578-20130828/6320_1 /ASSEMBLY_ACC=CAM_ASM_000663 /TAXON_ID=267565 /ORGANISM="Skeletonema grethea, Strain CCMP 1804" /LENGTH=187 /DNA_ID=CAMNT_0048179469 /DNA_START=17 /DNA_END=580 /DNA_ORIENTATION=-
MAIQRSNIANNSTLASNGGSSNNRARDLSPISPRSSNASSSSGAQLFNPRLILSQIISLQSFHYLVLGIIFQINHVLFATSITIDRIFTTKYIDVWSAEGWIDNSAILLSSLIGAVLLAIIVEKSKKCLDFSVTLFLIHIVTCSIYGGFPSTWDWWIVHTMGMIAMVVLGEYLCSKKELSDIPLLQL